MPPAPFVLTSPKQSEHRGRSHIPVGQGLRHAGVSSAAVSERRPRPERRQPWCPGKERGPGSVHVPNLARPCCLLQWWQLPRGPGHAAAQAGKWEGVQVLCQVAGWQCGAGLPPRHGRRGAQTTSSRLLWFQSRNLPLRTTSRRSEASSSEFEKPLAWVPSAPTHVLLGQPAVLSTGRSSPGGRRRLPASWCHQEPGLSTPSCARLRFKASPGVVRGWQQVRGDEKEPPRADPNCAPLQLPASCPAQTGDTSRILVRRELAGCDAQSHARLQGPGQAGHASRSRQTSLFPAPSRRTRLCAECVQARALAPCTRCPVLTPHVTVPCLPSAQAGASSRTGPPYI